MNWLLAIFKAILYASALGSILACTIMIVKLLLKEKLGARWHYCIWFLLMLRLLVPYAPQSPISIFNLAHINENKILQSDYIAADETNFPASNQSQNLSEQVNKILVNQTNQNGSFKSESLSKSILNKDTFIKLACLLWLAGVLILAVRTLVNTLVFAYRLKNQCICKNEEILELVSGCKAKLGVKVNIAVLETKLLKVPAIFGFLHPKLLLPKGIDKQIKANELEYIILHELAHLKRKDIIVGFIACILQIIHWFNPVIWYAFYIMRGDKESACDALALSYIDSADTVSYGNTIIKLLEIYSKPTNVYGIACIVNNKSQIKRRITMISRFKKNSYRLTVASAAILLVLGGVMLTNAKSNNVMAANKSSQDTKSGKASVNLKHTDITQYVVKGKKFNGNMLIINDPTKLVVGFSKDNLNIGKTTSEIAKENNAVCAINAGGFNQSQDGKTISPTGVIIHNGKIIFNDLKESSTEIVGLTDKGLLVVGKHSLDEIKQLNIKEAVSFGPALIVNGKAQEAPNWGIAPRTAIGQKADGSIILLTIDGRSIESIGATLEDVQNILIQYGAVNAANLDGGGSSTMYYDGKIINHPSESDKERKVPTTFMVLN
ncbi:MAG: M56 family metallopeptidase [Bacillota bacterium]|nr:M56 family metallopeptidase [Bacillota bacterium]